MPRKTEEGSLTEVLPHDDLEMAASYDNSKVSDPGFTPSFLYVERGPGAGQLVPVKQGVLVIGRASACELRIQHPSISRRHALLNRKGERFFLKDLGSQNGTFIHKDKLTGEREIFPGDQIALGNTVLKLRGPREANEPMDTAAEMVAVGPPHNALKIALFTAAAFIGLAGALVFALAKLSKAPSFEAVAEQRQPAATNPRVPATVAEPAVRPAAAPPIVEETLDVQPAAASAPLAQEEPTEEPVVEPAPRPATRPAAAKTTAKATRTPSRPARSAAAVRTPAPTKKVAMVVREEVDEEEFADEPSDPSPRPVSSGARSKILSAYASGNVGTALRLARSTKAAELENQLATFQQSYNSAHQALSARQEDAALKHFSAALRLDEQLAPEQSSYGLEIKRQLSSLYTLDGFRALDEDDEAAAKRAFTSALKFDPSNVRARKQLSSLDGAPSAAAPAKTPKTAAPKASIDDAFGDDGADATAKPASAPAKKTGVKSSIDDAFGDE